MITIAKSAEAITITIPIDTLVNAAENHPDTPVEVIDRDKFVDAIIEKFDNDDVESGLKPMEHILDLFIEGITEDGDESVELKD